MCEVKHFLQSDLERKELSPKLEQANTELHLQLLQR
jgi:hypothetical protein